MGRDKILIPEFDAAKLRDINQAREGRTLKVVIPATARNDRVMGFARDPHARDKFNKVRHTARVEWNAEVLFEGVARLLEASDREYVIDIREGGAAWAKMAAKGRIRDLKIGYGEVLSEVTVRNSWEDDKPVKFFPIYRDEYMAEDPREDLKPWVRVLSIDDYHPFLHVGTLVGRIFGQAGYRIESRFLSSELFRSLYMAGGYHRRNAEGEFLRRKMGFLARRLKPVSAVAGADGRVYADPKALYNTVGNIVESADPKAVDCDGVQLVQLYNNGGCFAEKEGKICYTAPGKVNVGFEYRLKFVTDHRIKDRKRLEGFDTVLLWPGMVVKFDLVNRYKDQRKALTGNMMYRVIVFGHRAGQRYRLLYTKDGVERVVWSEFEGREAEVATAVSGMFGEPLLEIFDSRKGGWVAYTEDWALYEGYVRERGETRVDVTIRTAPEEFYAGKTKYFDQIIFEGAGAGMKLTLEKECGLKAVFGDMPGYGSVLGFEDVAQVGMRQIELLEALAQMFNLRFLTVEDEAVVRIEPADDFYTGETRDWRPWCDPEREVVRRDRVLELHEQEVLCYQPGTGPVGRLEVKEQRKFGAWSHEVKSAAVLQGVGVDRNPVFQPSVNASDRFGCAPSARILWIGDRDGVELGVDEEVSRIVRYAGLCPLPEGEVWPGAEHTGRYPLAAFHFEGDGVTPGFTLCFDDRDKVEGLNRFHRGELARREELEQISIWLRLPVWEYGALFGSSPGGMGIGAVFRLKTRMGEVTATLARVGKYDPQSGAVCCVFDRLPKD